MADTPLPPLYIVGAGGHGREIAWLAQRSLGRFRQIRFMVERRFATASSINEIPVTAMVPDQRLDETEFVVAVGDPVTRKRLSSLMNALGSTPTTLIDPTAVISPTVDLGAGSVVCAGSILTTDIRVGCHVHVNTGCVIHHDSTIGDFSTLSPGVRIAGRVKIGVGVFVGIGAIIINGSDGRPLEIGSGCVVAAGACVTRSVEAGSMVAGVPAVRKR